MTRSSPGRARLALAARRVLLAATALLLLLPSRPVGAEPHFSVRTGLRCSRCHVSPTGGGKRTLYGTLFAQTSLALLGSAPRVIPDGGGAGRIAGVATTVATGEVTPWLGVGADARVANTTTFTGEIQNTFNTTQATVYLEVRPIPERLTLYLDEELGGGGAITREVFALVRGPFDTYLRGGRLFPPFGLRVLDDTAYTRRATGATFSNPDFGLEAGIDLGPLLFAVAVTNGSFSGDDKNIFKAVYSHLEANLHAFRLGISGAYNPQPEGCRAMGGLFGGVRLSRLALQGEVDYVSDRSSDGTRWAHQIAALVEADLHLTTGLALRFSWDFDDKDLERGGGMRQRFRLGVDLFPMRLMEVKVYYNLRQTETQDPLDRADSLEVVLHVYL
jgi:hypothetical protein